MAALQGAVWDYITIWDWDGIPLTKWYWNPDELPLPYWALDGQPLEQEIGPTECHPLDISPWMELRW